MAISSRGFFADDGHGGISGRVAGDKEQERPLIKWAASGSGDVHYVKYVAFS